MSNSLINKKIKIEELESISKIIVNKALRVIEANGNKYASNIIEYKNSYCKDIYEDLLQEITINIIENDYTIKRDAFARVNNYLYNIKKERVEIIINTDTENEEEKKLLDKNAYIKYINDDYNITEKSEPLKYKKLIEMLELTSRQLEILNIYSKVYNFSKTAQILGISKSTVSKTIYRIKDKIKTLDLKIA